jgi:RNA polymerase sigma-70 factor (ECF subfamily)
MSTLLRAFKAAATEGARGATDDGADLCRSLEGLYARGRQVHPQLRVGEEAFARYLARCMQHAPGADLDQLAAADLYLACACVGRARGAAAEFEAQYAKVIRRAVSRVVAASDDRKDAEQRVRQHLLVGAGAAGPALAKYPGRVPLARWIAVVAVRVAISLRRSENAERRLREKAGAEAIGVSPEHLLMKAEIRRVFEPAVEQALARLTDRDRLILRLLLVGGMTHHAIAKCLGLSHQAISKRLAKARESLMKDIRAAVAGRLELPKSELSSVMRLVASQLDVNVSRVLSASSPSSSPS